MDLQVGCTVGDYIIIGALGAGGMGKVFKVRNTISDRIEAMKVLLPDLAGEPDLADRFLREIKVLANLNHPNIAGLRTALRFENQLLMVMEFVEGVTLDERLKKGPLPVSAAVACVSQVLAALAYAHKTGVIHRDIKPANMMLTPDATVKLMDFGIAKSAADRKLTMTGTTMGSLYYMSPEQIQGTQTLDPRADLYSVGVSLYELVTGKHPFDGDSQFAIMSAHLQQTPVPPITLNPSFPQALNDLILLSVNRDPNGRFQTAEAFRNALNSVTAVAAPPVAAPTVPVSTPAPPPAAAAVVAPAKKSNRAVWATIGALCCVGILIAAIQFGPWKKAAADSPAARPASTAQAEPPAAPPPSPSPAPAEPAAAAQTPPVTAASAPVVPTSPQVNSTSKPLSKPARTVAAAPGPAAPPPSSTVEAPAAIPQNPVSAPPPQPDLSAQRAELQKVRESLVTLSARSASIHTTLDSIRRSQAASGLGLRGDWLQSASLMDSFLRGASDALAAGDAAGARDLMEKGERQVDKLEKALNK
jgi:serine/threonine-protein kinase